MTQAFNTGFRVWKPGKVDLPTIEIFLSEVTFVLKEISDRIFIELHMKTTENVLVQTIPDYFETKQAAMEYIHSISALFAPDDCINVFDGDELIEKITNQSSKGKAK